MDSPATSDPTTSSQSTDLGSETGDQPSLLRFLNVAGTGTSSLPREWEPGWLEVVLPIEQWEQSQLLRQGQPLELVLKHIGGRPHMVAEWPRSGPGHYEIALKRADAMLEQRIITVLPAKISQASLIQMLEDLESRLPAALAIGLQRLGALAGIQLLPPEATSAAAELVRLRRAVLGGAERLGLASVLEQLAANPYLVLASTSHWVDRHQARRPLPAAIAQALAHPDNLASDKRPERVLDARVEHTSDVYENRLIKLYATQVELRLRRLVQVFRAGLQTEQADAAHSILAHLLAARRKARFLESVTTPAYLPIQVTMKLVNHPLYRAAFESYLELHRALAVRLEAPALDAPLENLPHLYQLWGTLEVVQVVLRVALELGYLVLSQHLVTRDASGFFVQVNPNGQPLLALVHPATKQVIKVIPERTYPTSNGELLHSVSYAQRPDIAVEVERPGEPTRIYLFDPKYKLDSETTDASESGASDGKPKKADMDKMHTYRDAIRDEADRRSVRYASILYPGPDVHYETPGIEALQAYPGEPERLETNLTNVLAAALQTEPSQPR